MLYFMACCKLRQPDLLYLLYFMAIAIQAIVAFMGLASWAGSREVHALIYCSCSASASVLAGSLVVHDVS